MTNEKYDPALKPRARVQMLVLKVLCPACLVIPAIHQDHVWSDNQKLEKVSSLHLPSDHTC